MSPVMMTKPEGHSVTVDSRVSYPGALDVSTIEPLASSACTWNVGIELDPAGTETEMLPAPAAVGEFESRTFDGSALVIVTVRFPAGAAAPSDPLNGCCRSLPTMMLPMEIGGGGS